MIISVIYLVSGCLLKYTYQGINIKEYVDKYMTAVPIFIPETVPYEEVKPDKWIYNTPDENYFNFSNPFIVYNRNNENVYVTDALNHRIVIFDEDLNFITEFSRYGQGPGEINQPVGLNFFSNGNIMINSRSPNKILITDKNFNFINEIMIDAYLSKTNSNNRIYVYNPNITQKLFSIFDEKGNNIGKFGDLFTDTIDKNLIKGNLVKKDPRGVNSFNGINFVFDEQDNLYCLFREIPVIRKYDSANKLIYEKNLSFLPAVQDELLEYEIFFNKSVKRKSVGTLHVYLFYDISIDQDYLYINTHNIYYETYVLDKNDAHLVKRIKFANTPDKFGKINDRYTIASADYSSQNYIYAIIGTTITRFKK